MARRTDGSVAFDDDDWDDFAMGDFESGDDDVN